MFASMTKAVEMFLCTQSARIPLLNRYLKTRGGPFLLAWFHRISGVLLVGYLWLHIYTLQALLVPDRFDQNMALYRTTVFTFLEWLLAIPVIFHALNGGRLVLYELYGLRNEASVIRWVFGFSVFYVLFVGLMMLQGDQAVTNTLYWLGTLVVAICLCALSASRIWYSRNPLGWKLQRFSGVFLMLMVPAHLLFMHLQPSVGHDAGHILQRLQSVSIRCLNVIMLLAALYHGSYGLFSLAKDYLASKVLRLAAAVLLLVATMGFAISGFRLMLAL